MKEQKLYICEFCNTQYASKEEALACEKSHQAPKKIINSIYHSIKVRHDGYPTRIEVEFENGKSIWYSR